MWEHCSIYSNKSLVSTAKRYLLTPYYWIRYQLLILKDDINSNKYLKPKPEQCQRKKTPKINFKVINDNIELRRVNF